MLSLKRSMNYTRHIKIKKYHTLYITIYFRLHITDLDINYNRPNDINFCNGNHFADNKPPVLGCCYGGHYVQATSTLAATKTERYVSSFKTCNRLLWTAHRCTFLTLTERDKTVMCQSLQTRGSIYSCWQQSLVQVQILKPCYSAAFSRYSAYF
jgi:hypothetical protein